MDNNTTLQGDFVQFYATWRCQACQILDSECVTSEKSARCIPCEATVEDCIFTRTVHYSGFKSEMPWHTLCGQERILRESESPEDSTSPLGSTNSDPWASMNIAALGETASTDSFTANAFAASDAEVAIEPSNNLLPPDMVLDPHLALPNRTCSVPSDLPADTAAAVDPVSPSTSGKPSSLITDAVNETIQNPQPSVSSLKEAILPQKLADGEAPTRVPSKNWPWQVERKSTKSGGFVAYCDECSNCYRAQKEAMAKSSLLRHKEQVHGLERPYKCPNRQKGCDFSARTQGPVVRHSKVCGY